jgi:hypothetical protein
MGANATRAESFAFRAVGAPCFAPPLSAVHPARVPETTCRRTYDHRLRELAYHAGDPGVAQRLGVPRSTARSWMRRGMPDVVTLDVLDPDAGELRVQVVRLENRVRMLLAIVRLLFCVLRISGVRLDGDRVPSGDGKTNYWARSSTPGPASSSRSFSGSSACHHRATTRGRRGRRIALLKTAPAVLAPRRAR